MTIRPSLLRGLALGLLAAAALAGVFVLMNRGSQPRLEGSILKVRVIGTDNQAAVVVADVRLLNPARALFMVKEIVLAATLADGSVVEGKVVAQPDLDRVLAYYPLSGARFTPMLRVRDRLKGGEQSDRTLAASFAVGEAALQGRRALRARIVDADGAVVELSLPATR
jgi:hypothetical protein